MRCSGVGPSTDDLRFWPESGGIIESYEVLWALWPVWKSWSGVVIDGTPFSGIWPILVLRASVSKLAPSWFTF